jgi:hypothetical protein
MKSTSAARKILIGSVLKSVFAPALTFALIFLPICSVTSGYAQQQETDVAPATWKESAVQFPAPPKKENLLSFPASISKTLDFTIDAKSVTVENDGVVRYTLVITSNTGASNVSYEGIRCSTSEKKLYAFGQADGSWSAAKRDTWDLIFNGGINRQHVTLAKDFFCDGTRVAGKAENIVERIRKKKPLK